MKRYTKKLKMLPVSLAVLVCLCSTKTDIPSLKYPVKHFRNYSFKDSSPLVSRVEKTPGFVLDYMKDLDGRDYTSYIPDREDMKVISNSLRELPPLTKRVMKKKLLGIYFINNLWGSGFADWVIDRDRNIYVFLIFNPTVLKKGMSGMITDKERSCFINDDKSYDIKLDCGEGSSGFLYILLHESGHVVDYAMGLTPYTEPDIIKVRRKNLKETFFTKGIWKDYKKATGIFPFMERVTFYGFSKGPKINISEAAGIYRELSGSPFVSLYSTLNWAEDAVELMTFYHITERMKRPFVISVLKDGQEIYRLEPMKNPLVRKRFSDLKFLYR